MINSFEIWEAQTIGGLTPEEDFILRLKHEFDKRGQKYEILSTPRQLKNGTVEIVPTGGEDMVKRILEEWNLKPEDFPPYKIEREELEDKVFNGVVFSTLDGEKASFERFTVYSRGAVRVFSASSDSFKFSPNDCEKAVTWIMEHFSRHLAESMFFRVLDPFKFMKQPKKPPYSMNFENLKDMFTDAGFSKLKNMPKEVVNFITVDLAQLLLLPYAMRSMERKRLVDITTDNRNYWSFQFRDTGEIIAQVTLRMRHRIKRSQKTFETYMEKDVQVKVSEFTGISKWDMHEPSFMKVLDQGGLPEWLSTPLAELTRKAPDEKFFQEVRHKYRGSITGHGYGI